MLILILTLGVCLAQTYDSVPINLQTMSVEIQVGTPAQNFSVTLDTQSSISWIPTVSINVTGVPLYNQSNSSSYQVLGSNLTDQVEQYTVSGQPAFENVTLGNMTTRFEMIFATNVTPLTGIQYTGMLGLGNNLKFYNIFDAGMISKQIQTWEFGIRSFGNVSELIFNSSSLPSIYWQPVGAFTSWQISIFTVTIDQSTNYLGASGANGLVNLNSQTIQLTLPLYGQFIGVYAAKNCILVSGYFYCNCSNANEMPDIDMSLQTTTIKIHPQGYLSQPIQGFDEYCQLLVEAIEDEDEGAPMILGQPFFYNSTIVFDKLNQRIGIVSQYALILLTPILFVLG